MVKNGHGNIWGRIKSIFFKGRHLAEVMGMCKASICIGFAQRRCVTWSAFMFAIKEGMPGWIR
jgi:hypothetical protein